jgi:hypothetical protein
MFPTTWGRFRIANVCETAPNVGHDLLQQGNISLELLGQKAGGPRITPYNHSETIKTIKRDEWGRYPLSENASSPRFLRYSVGDEL